jgi:hypothetical protein
MKQGESWSETWLMFSPGTLGSSIEQSLYEHESTMNGFERMIPNHSFINFPTSVDLLLVNRTK